MIYIFLVIILFSTLFDYTAEKRYSLKISFFLLFFLAAFQSRCSIDYLGYRDYWDKIVNDDPRDLEPFYCFLISIFEPIGYHGWLIVCAVFNIGVYYYLVKKYVEPQYYWVTIAVYTLWMRYFFQLVNCNRQTLSITLLVVMVECLSSSNKFNTSDTDKEIRIWGLSLKSLIFSLLCFIAAVNIHTSAYVGLILFPICFLCVNNKMWSNKYCITTIFIVFYLLRYVVDLSSVSVYLKVYFLEHNSHFAGLTSQISRHSNFSVLGELVPISFILLLGMRFKHLNVFDRLVGLSFLLAVFLQPLLVKDLSRITSYFEILFPILSVRLISKIPNTLCDLKYYFVFLLIIYGIHNFMIAHYHPLYHRWFDNFQLIFVQS